MAAIILNPDTINLIAMEGAVGTGIGSAAQAAADAQADADALADDLADISSDDKLSPVEKQLLKQQWDGIVAEKTIIDSQADYYGIVTEKTAYGNAYSALSSYITPLLADLGVTSDITGTTLRAKFNDYHTYKIDLLDAIAVEAKDLADAAQADASQALIQLQPDNIKLIVADSADEILSIIEENPDSIHLAVGRIGSNNLCKNGRGNFGESGWTFTNAEAVADTALQHNVFHIKAGGGSVITDYAATDNPFSIPVMPNTGYVFSYKVKGACNIDVWGQNSGSAAGTQDVHNVDEANTEVVYTDYAIAFVTGETQTSCYIDFTAAGEAWITDIQIAQGDMATDWTPAAGEFYTSGISIFEDEIDIVSQLINLIARGDTGDTLVQINSDGITVHNVEADGSYHRLPFAVYDGTFDKYVLSIFTSANDSGEMAHAVHTYMSIDDYVETTDIHDYTRVNAGSINLYRRAVYSVGGPESTVDLEQIENPENPDKYNALQVTLRYRTFSVPGTILNTYVNIYPDETSLKLALGGDATAFNFLDPIKVNGTPIMLQATNVTAINDTGIADGEIAVFNLTNKDIRTSNKTFSGADATIITGTKGTSGNLAMWNADGDAVDSGVPATDIAEKLDQDGSLIASLADDVATSFTPKNTIGVMTIIPRHANYSNVYGDFYYRTDTPHMVMGYGGSVMAVTTGALSNGSGTDGKVTVSAHTDGKIYISNRHGRTISITHYEIGR